MVARKLINLTIKLAITHKPQSAINGTENTNFSVDFLKAQQQSLIQLHICYIIRLESPGGRSYFCAIFYYVLTIVCYGFFSHI